MRWFEIVESAADAADNETRRQVKARQKISGAQRKRSAASRQYQDQLRKADDSPGKRREAGQRYQDKLRSANDAQQDAQAKLRTT